MTYSRLQSMVGAQFVPGEFLSITLKANYRSQMPSMEAPGQTVSVSTNSFGLRGAERTRQKPPGTRRILVLGDSYTFGLYCDDADTYPAVLERLYAEDNERVEVLNAGYAAGSSPDEHYAWLMRKGFSFDPDVVVYGFFVGNDIEEIVSERWHELDELGLPRRVSDPDVWVDEYGRPRSRVDDWKTVGHEWIFRLPVLRESHLFVLMNRAVIRLADPDFQNQGWGSEPFSFILQPRTPPPLRESERRFFRLVEGLNTQVARRGARFVLLMIPVNFQVEPDFLPGVVGSTEFSVRRNYFDEIKPVLGASGVEFVDVLKPMTAHAGMHFFPRNGEVHMNARGNAFTAAVLKRYLDGQPARRMPGLPAPERAR